MFTHYPDHTVVFTYRSVMSRSMGCAFILHRNDFKFRLNLSVQFLPPNPLHPVRHLLQVNFCHGSFYCVQTPLAQSMACSFLISPTHSHWRYSRLIMPSVHGISGNQDMQVSLPGTLQLKASLYLVSSVRTLRLIVRGSPLQGAVYDRQRGGPRISAA
jgi:hypothetical protein